MKKGGKVKRNRVKIVAGIVAYNNPKELDKAIRSISLCPEIVHLIVVDNSESKFIRANQKVIRKYFKNGQYTYIRNTTKRWWNKGSARGFNIVMKEFLNTNGDYLLLLDQDGQVNASSLKKIFQVNSDIYCPIIYDPDSHKPLKGAKIKKYILGVIIRTSTIPNSPTEILVCATNGMIISKRVIKEVKYDYRGYFANLEDFDFCLQARRRGYKCYLIPEYIVYHPSLEKKHRIMSKRKYLIKNLELNVPSPFYFGVITSGETRDRFNISVYSASLMIAKYDLIGWIISFIYSSILTTLKKIIFRGKVSLLNTFEQYKRGFIDGRRLAFKE